MATLRNIRLTLAYDGTNYCGWQVQANGPSIQAALERAIERLTGAKSAVYSAGRTDSGVHALGQVANFHTEFPIPPENFRPALQTKLPEDIVILDSCEAPPEFHATYAAKSKRYRYVIDNSPHPLPFLKRYAWQMRRRLDADAMHVAGQSLLGTHDFRSFETDWPNKATSVRTVTELRVARRRLWELWEAPTGAQHAGQAHAARPDDEPRNGSRGLALRTMPDRPPSRLAFSPEPLICLDIVADGFLYNMVRCIVGTLVNVGRSKWTADDVARILETQQRSIAGSTAPACGLYLVEVEY